MEHGNHIDQFDGFFKGKMEGFEPQPPANLWSDIEQASELTRTGASVAGKTVLTVIMKAAAILLPAAAIGWYVISGSQQDTTKVPQNIEKEIIPPTIQTPAGLQPGAGSIQDAGGVESMVDPSSDQAAGIGTQPGKDAANPGNESRKPAQSTHKPALVADGEKGIAGTAPAVNMPDAGKQPLRQGGMKLPEETAAVKFYALKTEVCMGETVQLTNISVAGFEKYQWDFDDENTFDQSVKGNVTHLFREAGVYNVTLTAYKGKRTSSFTERIRVVAVQAYFTVDRKNAPSLRFVNQSNKALHYTWDFGDHSNLSQQVSPEHRFAGNENINVRLIAANGSCADTFQMELNPSVNEAQADIFIPNLITPNSDGLNDSWKITADQIVSYRVLIMDRNGRKIFESNNPQEGWNGVCSDGKYCPPGDYYYMLRISQGNKAPENRTGLIKLIR